MVRKYAEPVDYPQPESKGLYLKAEIVYHFGILKSGKQSKRLDMFLVWHTELFQCEACKCWGSPRKVCYRPMRIGKDWTNHELCLGCCNKVRAASNRLQKLDELKELTKILKREKPDDQ